MVTVTPHPMQRVLNASEDEIPAAFMQFFGELCASPIVQVVGVSGEERDGLHLWVRLDLDDDVQEEGIYRPLQHYRASDQGVPVHLNVVLAMQPDGVFPADAHVLYRRP